MQHECTQLELSLHFTTTVINALKVTIERTKPPTTTEVGPLREVIAAQATIGYYNMTIGLVAKKWTRVLKTPNVKHPEQKMKQVLSIIWDHICEQLRLVRNSICHSNDSYATVDEMTQLAKKLMWYIRCQAAVLDYQHIFIAAFAVDNITRWLRTTRQAKLELLNNAHTYY